MTDKLVIDTSLDDLGGPLIMRVFRKQITVEQARAIKQEFGWMGALMLERLLNDELTEMTSNSSAATMNCKRVPTPRKRRLISYSNLTPSGCMMSSSSAWKTTSLTA